MASGPSDRGSDPRKRTSGASSRGAARRSATSGSAAGARPGAGPGARRGAARQRVPVGGEAAARPRLTGRAAILVLVLALLMVSYASSMRAYLQQRHHLSALSASIATSQAEVDRLTQEKKRWKDPAYVRTVAHQRFGWVMPGEIGFQVLDKDGKPLGETDTLSSPSSVDRATAPVWWQSAWSSVEQAGRPQVAKRDVPAPVTTIRAPKASTSSR